MIDADDPASMGTRLPTKHACPQPNHPGDPGPETHAGTNDDEAAFESAVAAAIEKGKIFAGSEGDYHARLADLLPELSRVRKHIHQRLESYKKGRRNGAPNWGKWLGGFKAETGVRLSDKTIKKELDIFDGIKPSPHPRKPRVKTVTAALARKMGLALLTVREILDKVQAGDSAVLTPEEIVMIQAMCPSTSELNRIVEALREDTEAQLDPSDADGHSDETARTRPSDPALEDPLPPLKAGDVTGLTDRLIEQNLADFQAVFTGVRPDVFATRLHTLTATVANRFRKRGSAKIAIQVRPISARSRRSSRRESERCQDPSLPDSSARVLSWPKSQQEPD